MEETIRYYQDTVRGLLVGVVGILLILANPAFSQNSALSVQLLEPINEEVDEENIELTLDNIVISGNKKTKEKIILRELDVQLNQPYTLAELKSILEVDRNKIYNTSLFNAVDVNIIQTVDNRALVEIVVSERWYLYPIPKLNIVDRNFNDWIVNQNADLSRIEYGLKLNQYNFRGRNEQLNFLLQFGFTRKFGIGYSIPYLDASQRLGMAVQYNYSENKNTGYNTIDHIILFVDSENILRRQHNGGVQFTFRNSFFERHFFSLDYRNTTVADTVVSLNPNYFLDEATQQRFFTMGYSFVSDHRDIVAYPLNGYRFGIAVNKIGLGIYNDIDKLDFNIYFSKFFELKKRFFFSNHSDVYLSFPQEQPYANVKGLGFGRQNIRGYELNVIQGQHFFVNKSTFKKELFKTVKRLNKIPLEQFRTFPIAMYIKTYFDFGYVRNLRFFDEVNINTRLSDKIIWGTGIGLDTFTFYDMVIRLEYSLNSEMETGFFFHLNKEF